MEFPSNSHNPTGKSTPKIKAEKKVEKVISGAVTQKKKPIGVRFKAIFKGGEFRGATQYVFMDVLVPAVKNMVVDAVDVGIKRMVYGDGHRSGGSRRYEQNRSRMTYNSPVNRGSQVRLPDQPPYPPTRSSRSSSDIILNTREEAELVVSTIIDIIDKYDCASVSDFNTILGLPSAYVDNNWGWTDLQYVNIKQVREGFLLDMPAVESIV